MRKISNYLVLTLLSLCAMDAKAATQQLWVLDRGNLIPIVTTQGYFCDHWTMLLFADGSLPVFGQQWGAIDGTTADNVEMEWQRTRMANTRANAFLHIYGPQTMGYDAHLGPVCILGASRALQKSALTDADALFNKILAATYDKLNQLNQVMGFISPSDAQYLSNLNLIRKRVDTIRNWLNATDRANMTPIAAALRDAEVSAQRLFAQNPVTVPQPTRARPAVSSKPAAGAQGGVASNQSWNGKMITNSVGQPEGVSILSGSSVRFDYSLVGNMGSGPPQSVQTDVQIPWVNRVILEDTFVTVACDRTLQAQPVAGGAQFDGNYYVRIKFANSQDAQNFAAWIKARTGVR